MADTNSAEVSILASLGAVLDPGLWGAKPEFYLGRITLASQVATDILTLFTFPAGVRPLCFGMLTDTSLGSSTLNIGIAGTATKYKDAATFTVTDTMQFFRKPDQASAILDADEEILAVVATATLPSSGNLWILGICTRH